MHSERPNFTPDDNGSRGPGRRNVPALVSAFLLIVVFGTLFAGPKPAKAQFVDPVQSAWQSFDHAANTISNSLVEAAVVSVVNGVNYFTSQIAYQAAVALTSSCPGQVVCWDSKSFNQGFTEAWQGAIGEAIGTLSDQGGFTALGFNLCKPSLNLTLRIQLGLLDELKPPPPKCNFAALAQNWSSFSSSVTTGQVLSQLKPIFQPGQSPLAVSLGTFDAIKGTQSTAERNSIMKSLMDASAGGGFSAITDPVTGRVKSPGSVTKAEFDRMEAQQQSAIDNTQVANAGSIARGAVASVVINSVQTFTQTLVARVWNNLARGLLSTEEVISLQPDLILNPDALLQPVGTTGAEQILAVRMVSTTPRDAGVIDPLLDFSNCPTDSRSSKNCVLDQQLANAIRVADATPFTIRDALKQGMLHGDWPLISSNDQLKDQDPYCYTYGYCESNLKKMRAARIISIGWEIAADESPVQNPTTLQTAVDHFNDCNNQGSLDSSHPYCKLIDPDWVLRIPLTECRATGWTEQLVAQTGPTRAQSCVDEQTCLKQDDKGNCVGGWGYCTQERNVWRFSGDSCPAQFNTCRVLTSSTGSVAQFDLNTIDHGVCNADNVGCTQYSLAENVVSCSLPGATTCSDPNGCSCTVTNGACSVTHGQTSCTDEAGDVCRLQGLCGSTFCNCMIQSTCRVKTGEHTCSSTTGSDTTTADDWKTDPSRFFNAKAQSCDPANAGCSALVSLGTGQSLNLIRNGGFEQLENADGDGQLDHAQYWSPLGDAPSGGFGSILRDGTKSVSGSNAVLIKGTGPSNSGTSICSIASSCTNSQGCTCDAGNGYTCLVALGTSKCSVITAVMQTGIRVSNDKTYTVSFSMVPVTGSAVGAKASLVFFDELNDLIPISPADAVSTTSISGNDTTQPATVTCGGSNVDGRLALSATATKLADAAVKSVDVSCTFVVSPTTAVSHAILELASVGTDGAYVDNVQLEEGGGTPFHEGYGSATSVVDAKIPPAYLGCTGDATDVAECNNYAGVCNENEIGCDLYTPTNGDPAIPAITGPQDSCPAECAGYDVFKQESTQFDQEKFPVYFIPSTAKECSEGAVGCSQFTNVDTEAVAYYSQLRLCVKTDDPTVGVYYSWEGSDTTGYQLMVWNLKNTAAHVAASTSDVCAVTGCNPGSAPCTALDNTATNCASVDTSQSTGSTVGLCTRADIDSGNFDCRELYDKDGNRHYRLLSDTIIASADCHAYRITTSTQEDCATSSGRWDPTKSQCIYSFDSTQSRSCSASENDCRAYKGNASTNIRTIVFSDFESGLDNWTDGTDAGTNNLHQSSESVTVGGHSLDLAGTGPGRLAHLEVGGMVAPSRSYTLTFWAQGSGVLNTDFADGPAVSCTLATTCTPANGATTCTCTTGTGLTCDVPSGGSACTVPVATPPTSASTAFSDDNAATTAPRLALSPQWKQYSLGPVIVPAPAAGAKPWGSSSVDLEFSVTGTCGGSSVLAPDYGKACTANSQCSSNVCSQSDIFVDNVQLKEVQDSIFVVRDSWKTPASCDMTTAGAVSPQEMLGCKDYKNVAGNDVYLRSFSQLCRERSVGCAAYSDTRNTQDNPYPQTFNAVCRIYGDDGTTPRRCGFVECVKGSAGNCTTTFNKQQYTCVVTPGSDRCEIPIAADAGASCVCNYDTKHPAAALTAPLILPDVCNVAVGQTDCTFSYDGWDNSTRKDESPDRVNVDADRRVYLVVKPGDMCTADQVSCTALGQAHLAYEGQCALKDGSGNPTKCYAEQCVITGGACVTNSQCHGGPADVCAPASCPCTITAGNGRCDVPYGQQSCTASFESGVSDSWKTVAIKDDPTAYSTTLCKQPEIACQAYSASDGTFYFKDPGDHVCVYQDGVTINGQLMSGWFRKSASGSYFPCYPEFLQDGITYQIYKNADPTCSQSSVCNTSGGCLCYLPGNANAACKIPEGGTTCGYQGWVGQCDAADDRCEEFVDPNQTTATNPTGTPYYYLQNSKLDLTSCGGNASLKQGCVLFKQTSNTANLYSAATTYYKSYSTQGNGKVPPVNCNLNPRDPACNNRCESIYNGACSSNAEWQCHQDSDCRRCSTNPNLVCSSDSQCPSGGTCGAPQICVGDKRFTSSCSTDADCNAGQGEICESARICGFGLCKVGVPCYATNGTYCDTNADCSGNFVRCLDSSSQSSVHPMSAADANKILGNDANLVIKVNPDRECAEWLACKSFEQNWDPQQGKVTSTCTGFGPCIENKQIGQVFECVKTVEPSRTVFTSADYSTRDTSWNGVEYSGYTIIDRFSPAFLAPINIVKGRCAKSTPPYKPETPNQFCMSSSDCTTPDICLPLSGICQDAETLNGHSCDSSADCYDATTSPNGYCSFTYAATQHYGIVLDPTLTCKKDSDCGANTTGEAQDGSCVSHHCAYNYNGGKFDVTDPSEATSCRAFPESDAPFPSSIIDSQQNASASASHPGYDDYGHALSKATAFSGANTCGRGNDCSCDYSRWTYGAGAKTQFLSPPMGTDTGPVLYDGDSQIKVDPYGSLGTCVGGPYEGKYCDSTQKIVTQDMVDQALANNANNPGSLDHNTTVYDPCDQSSGGICQKLTSVNYLQGWHGFCIDPDKSINVDDNPGRYGCNLWLPVDALAGIPDNYNQYEEAGYVPNEPQLMYCTAAQGNALGGDSSNSPSYDYQFLTENPRDLGSIMTTHANGGPDLVGLALGYVFGGGPVGAVVGYISGLGKCTGGLSGPGNNNQNSLDFSQIGIPPLYENQFVALDVKAHFWNTRNTNACQTLNPTDEAVDLEFYLTPDNNWTNGITWDDGAPDDKPEHGGLTAGAQNGDCWGQNSGTTDCMSIRAKFNPDGSIQKFEGVIYTNSPKSRVPTAPVTITAKMRENCAEVVQVHDATRTPRNVAWTDKLYQDSLTANFTDSNGLKYGPTTTRPLATNTDLTPFGRIDPAGLVIFGVVTGDQTLSVRYPLSVFDSEGGSPYTYFQTTTPTSTNVLPFDLVGPNAAISKSSPGVTTGPVQDVAGYPYGCIGPCRQQSMSSEGTAAYGLGEDRLAQYFAEGFIGLKYDYTADPKRMSDTDPFIEQHTGVGDVYTSTGAIAYDKRGVFSGLGDAPRVLAASSTTNAICASGVNGLCVEGSDGLSVGGKTVDAVGTGGRYTADITFYAYADPNHMPIRRKIVDFGDGTTVLLSGAYKNHRGCKSGTICDTASEICGSMQTWGYTPASCDSSYFEEKHTYSCSSDLVSGPHALPSCSGTGTPVYPCTDGTNCVFKPRVQIMDNWFYCNGSCPGSPGGSKCFDADPNFDAKGNKGDTVDTNAGNASIANEECTNLGNAHYKVYDSAGDLQQPWTAFAGVIKVLP